MTSSFLRVSSVVVTLATPRLRREFRTMEHMVQIYCEHHHPGDGPCEDCRRFLAYAEKRLEKCPYGEAKPTCARCPVHCYKRQQREQAREIMRFAGPRMSYRHPWLALMHVLDKVRRVEHPMALRARRRRR
ncbi:MAG: nitrous oxide-stimulated promoter family protein [Gammaproteobacteria bacterium]